MPQPCSSLPFNPAFSRRSILRGAAVLLAAPAILGRQARAAKSGLTLWGPPAGPSITLAHGAASGAFASLSDHVSVKTWRSPDELRAGLTSGTMQVFVLPTQTAATLHGMGLGVRLVSVLTNGLLSMLSADATLTSIPTLRGKTVAVPFRNDTPDVVLAHLLRHYGLRDGQDVTVKVAAAPMEAVQLMLTGRADVVLLPEPAGSAAQIKAKQIMGTTLHRVMDVQQEWARATGQPPILPQAGLGIAQGFLATHGPAGVTALQTALSAATAGVLASPEQAASTAADVLGLPADAIARSIPLSNLVATPARDARPTLEALYTLLASQPQAGMPATLPPPEFYL